jgi:hypothetical protein
MELKYYFAAYFFWIIFNQTPLFARQRVRLINKLILLENKYSFLYYFRYPTTICAACFVFWCNMGPSLFFGNLFDLMLSFVLTFSIERLNYGLVKPNKTK